MSLPGRNSKSGDRRMDESEVKGDDGKLTEVTDLREVMKFIRIYVNGFKLREI